MLVLGVVLLMECSSETLKEWRQQGKEPHEAGLVLVEGYGHQLQQKQAP
jgi:hypothetical protein